MKDRLLELGFESIGGGICGIEVNGKYLQYVADEKVLSVFTNKGKTSKLRAIITRDILEYVKKHLGYINLPGKVQTNEHGVNVIVETEVSNNNHHSSYNKSAIITKILDRRDVEVEAEKVIQRLKKGTEEDWAKLLKIYADILKYEEGFAISQCSTPKEKIKGIVHGYGDIMKYELKK